MQRSESINELTSALSKAQGEMRPAIKESNNPYFKSKYADLPSVWETIRNVLSKNGLAVIQNIECEGNIVKVETMLSHSSGQWVSGTITMTAKDSLPQSIASASTYGRRYGLSAIVGVSSEEDDDGNQANGLNTASTASTASRVTKELPVDLSPEEQPLTAEQGKALMLHLNKNGWAMEDLKEYITYEFNIFSVKDIKNKHLLTIKNNFNRKKPVEQGIENV